MPLGILRKVFDRGVAAWKSGHRPGTTAVQWGLARVNSFVTKSKGTWGKADKDLADKVRASKKEEVELDELQKTDNPEDYITRKLKHKLTSKYHKLTVFMNLSIYNKVYQYFNLNKEVFSWDLKTVEKLAKEPPDMVHTITDRIYPEIYAIPSFFPNIDITKYCGEYSLDTIFHVRNFIVAEDKNILKTAMDEQEVDKLLQYLVKVELVKNLKGTNEFVVRRRKREIGRAHV